MTTSGCFVGVPRTRLGLTLIGLLALIFAGARIGVWRVSAVTQHETALISVEEQLVQDIPTVPTSPPTIPPPTEMPPPPPTQ